MQQRDRLACDPRRLLGRLGEDGVAGGERRRDLAGEDRERKIPRADADERAAPSQPVAVLLAGRAGKERVAGEEPARLGRIVAAEIDRLAHLRDAVVERLAALAGKQRDQPVAVRLDRVGGALQDRRALLRRRRLPGGMRRRRPQSTAAFARPRALHRRTGPAVIGAARDACRRRRGERPARLPNSSPREFLRAPKSFSGSAMPEWRGERPARLSAGGTSRLSTGTAWSLTALTKEELAPFSRSRRTR